MRQVRTREPAARRAGVVPTVDDPVAVLAQDDVALAVVRADHYGAAAVRERGADQAVDLALVAVAFLRDARLHVDLHALEILLEDQVHDARNRVRAVDGSGAARDDLGGAARVDLDADAVDRAEVDELAEIWRRRGDVRRLWNRDPSLWTGGNEAQWLGWLDIVEQELQNGG